MKNIKIFDTTLRDGEQTPGASLTIDEKIQIARQLYKLKVDVIEAGFAASSKGDFTAVETISKELGDDIIITSLSRSKKSDIDASYEALKHAKHPRIHVFLATSEIHLKYKLKMTEQQVMDMSVDMVKYAKSLCNDIQFSCEDAGRTRPEYLAQVVRAVIAAGATTVNIPDTVGYNAPGEFGDLIAYLFENVDNIHKADIAVHCHNDLGLAVANSLSAAVNGATQIECTINGLGERGGNASLEEIVMNLATRRDFYQMDTRIDTKQIYRTSRLVSALTGVDVSRTKAIVGKNAFSHESGIHQHGVLQNAITYEIMTPEIVGVPSRSLPLGKLSGRHAFSSKIEEMGLTLDESKIDDAFARFKVLADHKKNVTEADIEALIAEETAAVAGAAYELKAYQTIGGNGIVATSTITLTVASGDEVKDITDSATGNGPVAASINAINRIIGKEYTLERYRLGAVTEGRDALGEVSVRVSDGSSEYSGRGVSTDVIEASIRAYISAINKITI